MVLARAVYDISGEEILPELTVLSKENCALLARTGVAEILITDNRVADIPAASLFPASLEAKAMQALHNLLVARQGITAPISLTELTAIHSVVYQMIQYLFPIALGPPDLCGTSSLPGYDYVHPVKTAALSLYIGREANFPREDLLNLGLAAMLQNIGYLALPRGILDKPGALSPEEERHLRTHPSLGAEMLAKSGVHADVIRAIREHHERPDGSGYPEGRKGDEICRLARVISMADTYHSLLSRRAHREPLKVNKAGEFVTACGGELFDPQLAGIFARSMPQYPVGLPVKLNSGEIGIVCDSNIEHAARPVVRICFHFGVPVRIPYDLDLSESRQKDKIITEVLL
jgi:HD-GYP domain-containing protein (c-di-GMP phosphodiesterase class II)